MKIWKVQDLHLPTCDIFLRVRFGLAGRPLGSTGTGPASTSAGTIGSAKAKAGAG
jgi:hypothetical protein